MMMLLRSGIRNGSRLRINQKALRTFAGFTDSSCNSENSSKSGWNRSNYSWTVLSTMGAGSFALGTFLVSQPAFNESDAGGFFSSKPPFASSSPLNDNSVDKAIQEMRDEIRDRLKTYNKVHPGVPPVFVGSRGQLFSVRIPIPPSIDIYHIVVDFISRNGTDMNVRAHNSAVGRELTISHPNAENGSDNLCVVIFEPCIGDKTAEVEFLRKGKFTSNDLNSVVNTHRIASGLDADRSLRNRKGEAQSRKGKRALETLEKLGVKIYGLEELSENGTDQISWDTIAGYHEQKRDIEDNILLALKRPEVYDSIARGTRNKYESNKPRAVLFEGPPGTGKTSCARVIASQAGVPLLYVPLEVVTSKYYGESERLLSNVFNAGKELPDGAIVFLDEIDSLATTRDTDMHEATRRMLSVLLRQMDGFEQDKRVVVIAATNRKQDLDPALLSRFDAAITFDLPDCQTRAEIVGQYAKHLPQKDLTSIAAASEGMSGRDLREVCQQAERKWASKLIKGLVGNPPTQDLPPVQEYIESAEKRRSSHVRVTEEQVSSSPGGKGVFQVNS